MSLAQSKIHGPLGLKSYHSHRRSEVRPRFLKSASFTALHSHDDAFTKLHGDASPQTPMHYHKRLSFGKQDLLKQPHKRPWSAGAAPGKKSSQDSNAYHWVWITDMQRQGKWTRKEKAAYYERQDRALRESKPHNETNATRNGPGGAHWWALSRRGSRVGGYDQKLDVVPSRQTGLHLKHGMYKGSFENVKPYQYVNQTGRKDDDGNPDETVPDVRETAAANFKNTIAIRNWRDMKWSTSSNCITFGPLHTDTCSTMGIYYTHR